MWMKRLWTIQAHGLNIQEGNDEHLACEPITPPLCTLRCDQENQQDLQVALPVVLLGVALELVRQHLRDREKKSH